MHAARLAIAVAVATPLALAAPTVRAQALTRTLPRVLPFTGHLEQDGQAVSATRAMVFRIYTSTADCQAATAPAWEASRQVQVRAGAFAVLLGDTSAGDPELPVALFREAPLALRVAVDGVALAGCQLLYPAAHAQRSAGDVPLGTVIDWWRPAATVPVPEGYKVCDGTVVDDARSPFDGTSVPDLRGRFVRGAQDASQIGSTGGSDAEQAHQDNTHNHAWSFFTSEQNWYTYRDDGTNYQMVNWGDGIGDDGLGKYPVAKSSTVSDTQHQYTRRETHGHLPPADPEANVPRYVGLLKLVRIF